jgi:hypothetical protein
MWRLFRDSMGANQCGVSQLPTPFAARSHRQLRDISHTRILFLLVSLMSPNCRASALQIGRQFGDGTPESF